MRLLIVGAGGHGKVAADCAESMGSFEQIQFADEIFPQHNEVGHWSIVSNFAELSAFIDENTQIFVAIGNNRTRQKVSQAILRDHQVAFATLIHPSAVVSESSKIGQGTIICAQAVVNPYSEVGEGCIVNTASSIDHDNIIGDYVHISVGARIAGSVVVGSCSFVCINATVSNNLSVGENATVGAGAVVIKNVADNTTVVGVPARSVNS